MHTPRSDIQCVETWISLPANRRPSSWSRFSNPVCRLRLNLYGHPLAGLYWEKFCQTHLYDVGFARVSGWECLYYHSQHQLFLSVYVDDFKLAGNRANLQPMWDILSKRLDLDPPTPLDGSVYLGCCQYPFSPPYDEIKKQNNIT